LTTNFEVKLTKRASKDYETLKRHYPSLAKKAREIRDEIKVNPFLQADKKLSGLGDTYAIKLNNKHRFVYEILKDIKTVKVVSMYDHY